MNTHSQKDMWIVVAGHTGSTAIKLYSCLTVAKISKNSLVKWSLVCRGIK